MTKPKQTSGKPKPRDEGLAFLAVQELYEKALAALGRMPSLAGDCHANLIETRKLLVNIAEEMEREISYIAILSDKVSGNAERAEKLLASATERLEEMRQLNTPMPVQVPPAITLACIHCGKEATCERSDGAIQVAMREHALNCPVAIPMHNERTEAYLRSHVEEVRDILGLDPRSHRAPIESKACGNKLRNSVCQQEVGHEGPHRALDGTYWTQEQCGAQSPKDSTICELKPGHGGQHEGAGQTWFLDWKSPAVRAEARKAGV